MLLQKLSTTLTSTVNRPEGPK